MSLDVRTLEVVRRWLEWRNAKGEDTDSVHLEWTIEDHIEDARRRRAKLRRCEDCRFFSPAWPDRNWRSGCEEDGDTDTSAEWKRQIGAPCGPSGKLWHDKYEEGNHV